MSWDRTLVATRKACLDCSGTAKAVAYCTCDGVHSTFCYHWPRRFGKRPETVEAELGEAMVTPELMPNAETELEALPANPRHYRPSNPK